MMSFVAHTSFSLPPAPHKMKAATTLRIIGLLPICTMAIPGELTFRLQQVLDENTMDAADGTGLSLGVSLPDSLTLSSRWNRSKDYGVVSLTAGTRKKGAAGENDICFSPFKQPGSNCVVPTDMFAMGSTAKMYTAAAVLRLVDQGKFGLDDKALPLFDDLWTRLNGTSIVDGLGPQIRKVTVRHLLGMQSGVPDFDNDASRKYQFAHPQEDLGPVKEMSFLFPSSGFSCEPGSCAEYSSSNYELLGLILAQQAGKKNWDEYTQAEDLPELPEMTSTSFALHGVCSKYTDVHAYSPEVDPPVDVYDVSCTNGWTCGNLISNAADAAVFIRALLGDGERIITKQSRKEMLKFKKFDKSKAWAYGMPYGLGIMDLGAFNAGLPKGELVGHGGETYGFNAFTVYAKKYDFGLSVVANNEDAALTQKVLSDAYQAILEYLNETTLSTQAVTSTLLV